jgi:hypothetical protein
VICDLRPFTIEDGLILIPQTIQKIEVRYNGMVQEYPSKTMIFQLVRVTESLKSSAVSTRNIQEIHSNEDHRLLNSRREIFGKTLEMKKVP